MPPDAGAGGSPLRVGLVGYGLAGEVFHAPLVAATPGLRLAAVVTGDPERAGRVRRDHPGARVVPSADTLRETAGELDLGVVASPNRTHVPLARAALEAGMATVVDRPFAATVAETPPPVDPMDSVAGLEIIEAARTSATEGRVVEPGGDRDARADAGPSGLSSAPGGAAGRR